MKRLAIMVVAVALGAAVWAADDQFSFMPDGGRTILARLIEGLDPDERRAVLTRKASAEEWAEWVRARAPDLDDTGVQTVAGYAALNLPLDKARLDQATDEDVAAILPPDGKDLAVAQCQFCHSLFSSYLMNDRDVTGWKGTFKAPFHTEIPMSEVERDTFANYSALNMPLDFEDVPPELRF